MRNVAVSLIFLCCCYCVSTTTARSSSPSSKSSSSWLLSPSLSRRAATVVSLRGGSSSPGGGAGGDLFSTIGPIMGIMGKLLSEQVEPILKDPNGRIFTPAQEYLKGRAKEVQARQIAHRANPRQALSFVLTKPITILRLSLTAWLVAETLNALGILEDPALAKSKIKKAFQDARIEFIEFKDTRLRSWWHNARSPGGWFHRQTTWKSPASLKRKIASMEPKHQFALGATVGFALSPFAWCVGTQLLQSAGILYLSAEGNHILKQTSGKSCLERLQFFFVDGTESLEAKLEQVRCAVRRSVVNPLSLLESIPEALERFVPQDGLSPNTKRGLIAGLVTGIAVV